MSAGERPLQVLCLTNLWPFGDDPSYGSFVASDMRSVEQLGVRIDLVFINGRVTRMAYLFGALHMFGLNFRRRNYDLVHAHTGHCGVLARLQWRHPVLLTYIGYDIYGEPRADGRVMTKTRIEGAIFRCLSRLVDATTTKSSAMAALLPPSARRRNTVLPSGVDRGVFRPIPRDDARRQLGWRTDELVVLFAGRSDFGRKRVDFARRACELAARQVDGLVFRVCERLEHHLVPIWMNAADLLLLTSLAEGSPNVVKEALACNLPVVATDVGDVREVLDGVERCRVLPIDASVEGFATALVEVLAGAPARCNGRDRTPHLSTEVIGQRLLAIYGAVSSRGMRGVSGASGADNIAQV